MSQQSSSSAQTTASQLAHWCSPDPPQELAQIGSRFIDEHCPNVAHQALALTGGTNDSFQLLRGPYSQHSKHGIKRMLFGEEVRVRASDVSSSWDLLEGKPLYLDNTALELKVSKERMKDKQSKSAKAEVKNDLHSGACNVEPDESADDSAKHESHKSHRKKVSSRVGADAEKPTGAVKEIV